VRDPARIRLVDLVAHCRKRRARAEGLETDRREAKPRELALQPWRQRSGLMPTRRGRGGISSDPKDRMGIKLAESVAIDFALITSARTEVKWRFVC
jgi:hypothetical protein